MRTHPFLLVLALLSGSLLAPAFAGYDDAQGRFSFEPPDGWRQAAPADENGNVIFCNADNTARVIVLVLALPEGSTLPEVVSAYEGFLAENQPALKLTLQQETRLPVAGQEALRRVYTAAEQGGDRGRIVATFVMRGPLSVTVHASTHGDDFAATDAALARVCDTLRFGGADEAAIRAKLDALEQARAAGILSEEEYRRKRAELEAQLRPAAPALDEATRAKLAALEEARDAGILSEEEYRRKREELLAGRAPAPGPAPQPGPPSDPTARWPAYRHATGASFRYPPDWKIQEQGGLPQIVPPDPLLKDGAPMELYFVFGESLEGENITRPDDPRLLEYLDGQVQSLSPALQRAGNPRAVARAAGPACAVDWKAVLPDGGALLARCYVTLTGGHVLVLTGLGLEPKLLSRDAVLQSVFATLSFGAAPASGPANDAQGGGGDARLQGTWLQEQSFRSGDYASTIVRTIAFRNDGTCVLQTQGVADIQDRHGGGTEGGTGRGSQVQSYPGRWSASNGIITIAWQDGDTDRLQYYLEDPSQPGSTAATMGKRLMLVTTEEGDKQLWSYQG